MVNKSKLAVAVSTIVVAQAATATSQSSYTGSSATANISTVYLRADYDNSGGEGVYLSSQGNLGATLDLVDYQANLEALNSVFILADTDDNTSPDGVFIGAGSNDAFVNVQSNGNVNIGGDYTGGTYVDTGYIALNSDGGAAEVQINENVVDVTAAANITGTTSINTSGTAATSIGNTTGNVTIVGATNSITGTTNINTTGTAATTIGNSSSDTVVTARGGDSLLSLVDGQATLSSGTASFTSYSTIQTVGLSTSSSSYKFAVPSNDEEKARQQVVVEAIAADGASIQNIITGDTLVDGNVYINGSLTYSSTMAAVTKVSSDRENDVLVSAGTTVANEGSARYTVNSNGALVAVDTADATADAAAGTTAALTVTNEQGNTHGVVVTESQTTLSGGVYSSSMTLDDNGATFSDSATGAPIQVHGVNDGTADFDAVNVRQFAGAIAATAAMGNIPALGAGENGSFGLGVGSFMGYQGLAMGGNWRVAENTVIRATLATNTGDKRRTVAGVGAAWSW